MPLFAQQHRHQRRRDHRHPGIGGQRHQHHQPDRGEQRFCPFTLTARIGGKGDLVDRRHKFGRQQLRQKQPGRIDPQHVRIEHAPGDHHVGLALHKPEQLRRRHHPAEPGNMARAGKAETRPDRRARCAGHADGFGDDHHQRRGDQRPHAPITERPGQCGCRSGQRRHQPHLRRTAEIHPAAQNGMRQRAERHRQIEQCQHPQQVGHLRLSEPQGHQRRGQKLDQRQPAIHQNEHSQRLAQPFLAHIGFADQRAGQPPAVHGAEQHQHHLRHRKQPVILRGEQADHDQRRTPRNDLGQHLTARTPDHRRAHLRSQSRAGSQGISLSHARAP